MDVKNNEENHRRLQPFKFFAFTRIELLIKIQYSVGPSYNVYVNEGSNYAKTLSLCHIVFVLTTKRN